MILDNRYDSARIRRFASHFRSLDDAGQMFLRRMLNGTESPDFYAGLIAGLANAYQIVEGDKTLGCALSAVCDLVESKELLTDTGSR